MQPKKTHPILTAFQSKRVFLNLLLGFSCGIPLALTGGTLQAWITRAGLSISTIGAFSLVGMPYIVKFLWAPILDRYSLPILGKRRGWLFLFQILLFIGVVALGRTDPTLQLETMAILALCVSFFSASQDIVVDGFRSEILTPDEQGPGAGVYVMGYRLAMIVSGAVAMTLSDSLPWPTVYTIMASTMGIGVVATFLADEPPREGVPAKSLNQAFTQPLVDYFSRKGAVEIALFIVLYKIGDTLAAILATPFLIKQGYSNTVIGSFNKFLGAGATILGATLGGALLVRWGMHRALIIFGILQAVSTFVYVGLSFLPPTILALATAIGIENLCGGMGTAAFSALLMRLCGKGQAAGQFAVLSSLMAVPRVMLGPAAGSMAEALGWQVFFLVAVLISAPGTLMLARFPLWMAAEKSAGHFEVLTENRVDPATIFAFVGSLILFFSIPMHLDAKVLPLSIMASLAALMSFFALKNSFNRKFFGKGVAIASVNFAVMIWGYLKYASL